MCCACSCRALLPGPVTVLLPLKPGSDLAPAVLNPDNRSDQISVDSAAAVVGIRVVPNEFVRRVCRALGGGIALTSANLSGKESSLQTQDFRCGVSVQTASDCFCFVMFRPVLLCVTSCKQPADTKCLTFGRNENLRLSE